LAVRGPRKLLRVVPAPAAHVVPRRRARALLLAALLAVAFVMPWLSLGQHEGPGSFFERGATLLGKTKAGVVAVASAALAACVGLKVRTGEKDWLGKCTPEARKNVNNLELEADGGAATLEEGLNVIVPDEGVELRDGPVEASALISTPSKGIAGRLFGEIRTGADGASIHFTKLKLFNGTEAKRQPPAGRELEICAIASVRGYGADPGIPLVTDRPRPPDLHSGFVWVTHRALEIHFAH